METFNIDALLKTDCNFEIRSSIDNRRLIMEELFRKIVNNEFVNRNDESILFDFIARLVGEDNVLTNIEIEDHKTIYLGCAIRKDDKWTVYNLVGNKEGVVVKIGKRFYLLVREN